MAASRVNLRTLQNVHDASIRLRRVDAFLLEEPLETFWTQLNGLVTDYIHKRAPAEDLLLTLAVVLLDFERSGPGYAERARAERARQRAIDIYSFAMMHEPSPLGKLVAQWFLDLPAAKKPTKKRVAFGPKWDREVTLGERKALASGSDRGFLERLIYDADPQVIAKLLANPKIREQDVLLIATRRPIHPDILSVVLRSRWAVRYQVRRSLVLNPYNPTSSSLRLLTLIRQPELRAISFQSDIHPAIRAAAGVLVASREAGETASLTIETEMELESAAEPT